MAGSIVELDLIPTADLFQFQGHFPDHPIMPGVGQLDWAVKFARKHFSLSQSITEISQLKFRDLMLPDTEVVLTLEHDADKSRVKFSYSSGEQVFSSGILKLAST
ncbi:hypothetical protein RYZ26_15570 [Terasakiella sp. A23]|uniref:ApeI family dehydratase n=1 Tax=Terasakiella sp. FCG-A23 TaxID=3080561 RepID=UPI002954EAA1|nr:hypothetical protein [Terasakiella sp. A23]MDV7341025.1 hypothetical protein [Terasakiella sp. A23]